MKNLILLFIITSFVYSANEHKFTSENIDNVKKKLYKDITDNNINKSISYIEAKKLKDKIDNKFDKDFSMYKTNLKDIASNISNVMIKLQLEKLELESIKTALKNKKAEEKAKKQTIANLTNNIKKAKENKFNLNITKEFSTQGYYISAISMPLSTNDDKAKEILQNSIIVQSAKELSGQFVSSVKKIKNNKVILDYTKIISSARVNINNTSTNKLYSFIANGKKIFIYTTKVDLYPFDSKSTTIKSSIYTKSVDTVYLIEDIQELNENINIIKTKFNLNTNIIEKSKIMVELENIGIHNYNSFLAIEKIIHDVKLNKMKIRSDINNDKLRLNHEENSLTYIVKDIKNLEAKLSKLTTMNTMNKLLLAKKQLKLRNLKSSQIYTRAMIRDKKSSNYKKDIKILIDELVDSMDISRQFK